jgi:hypothetical protein
MVVRECSLILAGVPRVLKVKFVAPQNCLFVRHAGEVWVTRQFRVVNAALFDLTEIPAVC